MPDNEHIVARAQRREHKPQERAPGADPKGTGQNQTVPQEIWQHQSRRGHS